ncbi:MAG: glycosyltransferase family 4 protein [Rickettsiales bacterium]|nr:glycosyltransferase family 4 protein [Rickettsiales bacterium]
MNLNNSQRTIAQIIPSLESGGVERGVVDIAKAIKNKGWNSIVISNGGILTYQLIEAGVKHIQLPVHSKNPLIIFKNIKKLTQIIEDYKIDILHLRSRAPMISAYYAVKKSSAILVSTIHGAYSLKFLGINSSRIKKFYNSIMLRADKIIAVSNFIKNNIINNYQNPLDKHLNLDRLNQIKVIHRGVDLKYFNSSAVSKNRIIDLINKWNLPDDKKIIMLPARFTEWKGHQFLLNALAMVEQDYFCIMVGSDHGHQSFRKKIEQKIIDLHLEGKVKVVGNCKDMPSAFALSYLVLSTSIRPEAFGRVAIEAQSSSRIIIATNIGGSLETIIDSKTGFLVEPNNAEQLAKKIDEILSMNQEKYQEIANQARLHIEKNFSNQQMYDKTIEVYQEIFANR